MINDKNKPFVDDENIIDLTPSDNVDTSQQEVTENPVIIIESDDKADSAMNHRAEPSPFRSKWMMLAYIIMGMLMLGILVYAGWRYYYHNYYVELPISCSSSENIKKLQAPVAKMRPEVIFTHDSVGTVPFNLYELRGLKAGLTMDEPDSTDTDVYFYSRCADYDKKGRMMGTMVRDGRLIHKDNHRLGYCAMAGDNTVIGIARDEKVRDFVEDNGGSMFRQFVLVSKGEIPSVFHLHGVVERRAFARLADSNTLYYVESCKAETMYDFADAIRKYGFVDAIYVTGGKCYSYYRTADGAYHNIGLPAPEKPRRIPWIVFKKR